MKTAIFAALATGLLLFGTGCGNACDDAVAHIEDCGVDTGDGDGEGEEAECDEAAECAAECVSAASCETLKGEDLDGAIALGECATAC